MGKTDPTYPHRRRSRLVWLPLIVLIAACATVWIPSRNYHRTAAVEGNEVVGSEDCTSCHEDVLGHPPIADYHADCESCHGAGSLHAASEAPADTRFPSSADCLTCHESGRATHLAWATGEHERAGLICSDCHNPHNREPNNVRQAEHASYGFTDPNTSLCITCHPDVASRLRLPSHHPVAEGMLGCTDCHSPHGDTQTTLGARTQLCTSCHQDHAGPWIYEHPPAAEDCTACHQPHGTASYNLLDTSQPALCLSCHSLPDDRHLKAGEGLSAGDSVTSAVATAFYSRCTDCHGAIHGSYQDSHLRR